MKAYKCTIDKYFELVDSGVINANSEDIYYCTDVKAVFCGLNPWTYQAGDGIIIDQEKKIISLQPRTETAYSNNNYVAWGRMYADATHGNLVKNNWIPLLYLPTANYKAMVDFDIISTDFPHIQSFNGNFVLDALGNTAMSFRCNYFYSSKAQGYDGIYFNNIIKAVRLNEHAFMIFVKAASENFSVMCGIRSVFHCGIDFAIYNGSYSTSGGHADCGNPGAGRLIDLYKLNNLPFNCQIEYKETIFQIGISNLQALGTVQEPVAATTEPYPVV